MIEVLLSHPGLSGQEPNKETGLLLRVKDAISLSWCDLGYMALIAGNLNARAFGNVRNMSAFRRYLDRMLADSTMWQIRGHTISGVPRSAVVLSQQLPLQTRSIAVSSSISKCTCVLLAAATSALKNRHHLSVGEPRVAVDR